jgi:TonB family protein
MRAAHAQSVPAAPLDRPLPEYPAAAKAIEGAVKLRFRIALDGRVTDVSIVEANPPGMFDQAALDAVRQWFYQPRTEDGKTVEQPDNSVLLKFKPPPPETAPELIRGQVAYYPREAFDHKIEGDVTVGFDVNTLGIVEHAAVSESTVPDVFDKAALTALETMRFRTAVIDGVAQPAANQKMTIPFRLANARLDAIKISSGSLVYPRQALNAGLQGYCMTHYRIQEDGSVSDVEILDTYPREIFRQSCLNYIQTLKYAPPGEEPRGHVARERSMQIRFVIHAPASALRRDMKPDDWVRIQYTVTKDGHAKDVKVIQTSGPDVPTEDALEQIRDRRLKPFVENGVPTDKPNQIVVVTGPKQ